MNRRWFKNFALLILLIAILSVTACHKKTDRSDNGNVENYLPERENTEPQNDESVTVEQAVLNALDKLAISAKDIKKIQKDDAIYFYIPLDEKKDIDLDFADMVLSGQLELTGTTVSNVIREENAKVIREYLDTIHNQSYVIEVYYSSVQPGFNASEKKNKVAYLSIIVDDFGSYNNAVLDKFCESDPVISFAIIPGLPYSKEVMKKAVNSGHEVLVHIPMQADNPNANPGKNAILETLNHNEIVSRMQSYFAELPNAVGANQHMGSKISANKNLMNSVLSVIKQKNLFFVDSKTTARSVAYRTALALNIPSAERDFFLDAPANSDAVINQRLAEIKKLKDRKGKVLVITHCHDITRLNRLNYFIKEAEKMGFTIIPASKYVASEPDL